MRGPLEGDKLASGAPRATFLGPMLKFNEVQMRADFAVLPSAAFQEKYLITQREYDLLSGGEEAVNSFAEQMKRQAEFYNRGLETDARLAASLNRDCFLQPFDLHLRGFVGRVITDRDEPATPRGERGRLLIPRSLRKEKTLLPTTGRIIKAVIFDPSGQDVSDSYIGRRILFQQMSGSAICFNSYPTWTLLELAEILCWVMNDAATVTEETLEPMV